MEKCDVVQDLIPLYYDEVASEGSRAIVDAHIKNCAACTQMLESMKDSYQTAHVNADNPDIRILKRIKGRIVKKLAIATFSAVAGTVILLWIVFTWYVPTPFDADRITVQPISAQSASNAPSLVIRNAYHSVTFMQIEDTLYLKCKNTLYTRFLSQNGSGRWFTLGDPSLLSTALLGMHDDGSHLWEIGDDINRIYYLQADYNQLFRLAADGTAQRDAENALAKAKQKAVLVWER